MTRGASLQREPTGVAGGPGRRKPFPLQGSARHAQFEQFEPRRRSERAGAFAIRRKKQKFFDWPPVSFSWGSGHGWGKVQRSFEHSERNGGCQKCPGVSFQTTTKLFQERLQILAECFTSMAKAPHILGDRHLALKVRGALSVWSNMPTCLDVRIKRCSPRSFFDLCSQLPLAYC